MRHARGGRPDFSVTHESAPPETLVAGFSAAGLAGLTAVDYLVDRRDATETGHLNVERLPAITPFTDGEPRHHTRIFSDRPADLAVLVGELSVPRGAGGALAEAVLEWAADNGVEEITILSGVPVDHAPDEHESFYVATADYRDHRLGDADLRPMGSGFLDGVNAEILQRGLDTDLRVGLLTTPVHAQAPDLEAALRLLGALTEVYDVDVDTGPLEAFASEVRRYYAELVDRMERTTQAEYPEDRMFM